MKVKWNKSDLQMSEAFITCVFLALSGGFQDAYTYFVRDGVFSNAQTGNVVLMSQSFFTGDWGRGLRYLFPLLAFIAGVFVAEKVQGRFKYAKKIHWRQGILIGEILILLVVSFIPESLNTVATALVSFSCAMQVQAFRKVNGYSYASTMCIVICEAELLPFQLTGGAKILRSWNRQVIILELFSCLPLAPE